VRWAVGDGNWDTTTANWQLVGGGSGVLFANNDPVLLDDNATGSSPITINLAASRTPWSVTNNSTKNYTLTGAGIGGAAALTKLGSSTLTLANTNTFTGGTTISAGTLLVKSPGSLATNNAVTVQSAATLGGNGTINGAVTVNVGAALAPGLGNVGTLTLASAPALNGSVVAEVNATNAQTADKLVVSAGTLTYGGSLVVTNVGAALTGGETFTLFNAPSYAGNFTNYNLQNPGANLNWWVGNLTNNGTLFVNRAPTVNAASYSRASRVSLKLPVANLMTNASDADGHARFWVGVSATTTNGLTLTSDANFVYVPTNNVTDQFSYTVRDNYGGTNSGTVTLTVAVPASGQPLNLNPNTNSTVTVNFAGVPGLGYTVERGTNVAFTGVVRTWLVTAPTGGLFQVTDNFSDLGTLPFVPSAAYYRLKYSGQ
jgi:autotransporter-associated beta strand protein